MQAAEEKLPDNPFHRGAVNYFEYTSEVNFTGVHRVLPMRLYDTQTLFKHVKQLNERCDALEAQLAEVRRERDELRRMAEEKPRRKG